MSEKFQNDQEPNVASDNSYSFYWNYNDQLIADREQAGKKKKRGIVVYVTVLASVFLICFALLTATIIWYHNTDVPQVTQTTANTVSELVSPAVVLVQASSPYASSNGTGFVLKEDGYIVTNYHVIAGASIIAVTLYDGNVQDAELVGYRAEDDIAVLKIPGRGYPTVAIGSSDAMRVGDVAIAIGNPGGEDGAWSTTQGIISALDREISIEEASYYTEMTMLQTDAPVNPGNSGGPLCNANGEVIGILTRKMTNYEGVGYAIPINAAMRTINAILNDELDGFVSTVSKSRPKIGITGAAIVAGDEFQLGGVTYAAPANGFIVTDILPNSGAYGVFQVGDIVCGINGTTISDLQTLTDELYKCYVGQTVTFEVWRRNEKVTLEVTIGVSS